VLPGAWHNVRIDTDFTAYAGPLCVVWVTSTETTLRVTELSAQFPGIISGRLTTLAIKGSDH
jgi:hypothetical protein